MYTNLTATHNRFTISGMREDYQDGPNFRLNIQPATGESIALINGAYGKTFTAFTTYSGLNIGDGLTVSGTNIFYHVKAVRNFDYGVLQHFEATIALPEI